MASIAHRRILTAAVATGGVLAICVALAAQPPFDDLRRQQPIQGDASAGAAKAATCAACHGANGIAIAPTFPNLAGQSATYLYVQLRAYKDGSRKNAVMKPLATVLSDRDMRDLAAHFAALPAKTATGDGQASRGRTLYHDGDPSLGVPACQGCHGRDGHGPRPDPTNTAPQPAWSTFPALAGQNVPYVLEQLKAYHDGTRTHTSNDKVMQGVAENLTDSDMQALAAYVSSL